MHIDGGSTVFWGIVYLNVEPPSKKSVENALREAGFNFAHNVLTRVDGSFGRREGVIGKWVRKRCKFIVCGRMGIGM